MGEITRSDTIDGRLMPLPVRTGEKQFSLSLYIVHITICTYIPFYLLLTYSEHVTLQYSTTLTAVVCLTSEKATAQFYLKAQILKKVKGWSASVSYSMYVHTTYVHTIHPSSAPLISKFIAFFTYYYLRILYVVPCSAPQRLPNPPFWTPESRKVVKPRNPFSSLKMPLFSKAHDHITSTVQYGYIL